MQSKSREWLVSAGIGLLLAAACVGLSIWGLESAGMIFLPGALLAALIFPQGIHGDAPEVFMVLAFVFTAALVTSLVFLTQRWWLGRRRAQETLDTVQINRPY
jgi:hypothetical protein